MEAGSSWASDRRDMQVGKNVATSSKSGVAAGAAPAAFASFLPEAVDPTYDWTSPAAAVAKSDLVATVACTSVGPDKQQVREYQAGLHALKPQE